MTPQEDRTFAFNRRTVDDQTIYVRATSLRQAKQKARAGECFDASDVEVRRTTLRRLPDQDRDA